MPNSTPGGVGSLPTVFDFQSLTGLFYPNKKPRGSHRRAQPTAYRAPAESPPETLVRAPSTKPYIPVRQARSPGALLAQSNTTRNAADAYRETTQHDPEPHRTGTHPAIKPRDPPLLHVLLAQSDTTRNAADVYRETTHHDPEPQRTGTHPAIKPRDPPLLPVLLAQSDTTRKAADAYRETTQHDPEPQRTGTHPAIKPRDPSATQPTAKRVIHRTIPKRVTFRKCLGSNIAPGEGDDTASRMANPFTKPIAAAGETDTARRGVEGAWGLHTAKPSTRSLRTSLYHKPQHHKLEAAPPQPSEATTAPTSPQLTHTTQSGEATTLPISPQLTHTTQSGEAHMVDVSAKPATKRTAIAYAYIRFLNPEPFRLISENSNKKGDVLGTARVAGIMAAKQTAALIPLCHPLTLSSADLDIRLEPPGAKSPVWNNNTRGLVVAVARVQCTGPTGVEMEALTAATVAVLTVYDMCKAVDRTMLLGGSRMAYKSGGTSGLFIDSSFRKWKGPRWFEERGLEHLGG